VLQFRFSLHVTPNLADKRDTNGQQADHQTTTTMNTHTRNPLMLLALLLSCVLSCVQAAEPERTLLQDSDGFCVSLRNVSDVTLTQHLLELQQDLETQVGILKEEMKRKSFKAIDTLITVIMPGGMFYAGYRMDSYKKSARAMAMASEELNQISDDLNVFQSNDTALVLATVE
jgi:hypothetical protein